MASLPLKTLDGKGQDGRRRRERKGEESGKMGTTSLRTSEQKGKQVCARASSSSSSIQDVAPKAQLQYSARQKVQGRLHQLSLQEGKVYNANPPRNMTDISATPDTFTSANCFSAVGNLLQAGLNALDEGGARIEFLNDRIHPRDKFTTILEQFSFFCVQYIQTINYFLHQRAGRMRLFFQCEVLTDKKTAIFQPLM